MSPPTLVPGLGPTRRTPFGEITPDRYLRLLLEEIRELYRADQVPWVIGYSGGKDSTLVTALVWWALAALPPDERTKTVHVISTDTLVENPLVAAWVGRSLDSMREAAAAQHLPIEVHRLTPAVEDSFWTCLIGRGYAAPRPKFRWCTERLKIKPSNRFIRTVVGAHGEAILVLGIRKAESAVRAKAMARHEKGRVRDRLSPNGELPNSLVYSPIEALTNDEVWILLMQYDNPWGHSHKDLLGLYQGASPDSECPLVVDTTTPSCGDSRFGCWTCTMVSQDKSLKAMIANDDDNDWLRPLLELRNALDIDDDRHLRDYRRSNGSLMLFHGRLVHGPYTQTAREDWLRRLLRAQRQIRTHGPEYVRDLSLISMEELHAIRHEWVVVKHEIEDTLPGIYQEETGAPFPGPDLLNSGFGFGADDMAVLSEVCDGDESQYQGIRALLGVERRFRTAERRARYFEALEKTVTKHMFTGEDDALQYAINRDQIRAGFYDQSDPAPQGSDETDPNEIAAEESS
ncbi:DNA phosphorothioation system sulfurtransferase DndC [Streptomyces sp. OfavH-34-F]|uniref:DNA phosphorothioation system sulfurtransferase DndC n=1 Tax=Streptomyces sp. OfavH-34-F TaxID=2917760 RepID=UPI001EF3C9A3|nr:DNA phosphorothioation system sulfurtransferase DndC [Streptomyces sp. OfavH-34-F]MCG7523976.1 DNA phosphorothioation system sulfurtransferase DndC [Streptomyces sp. OfavH-34-F]